jgi:hypothetical protein
MARLLDNEVCSNLNIFAPETTLCAEAVLRLTRSMPKARRARQGLAQTKSQGEHLLHAESALYRAGIPHLLIPFQRDKFASNVFVVPSVPDAQHALIRAGFRHSNNAPSLLIDLETGSPIQVVEHTVAERICHAPELRFIHTDNAGVTHLTYL